MVIPSFLIHACHVWSPGPVDQVLVSAEPLGPFEGAGKGLVGVVLTRASVLRPEVDRCPQWAYLGRATGPLRSGGEGLSVSSQQVAPETEAWPGSEVAWCWLVLSKSEPRVLTSALRHTGIQEPIHSHLDPPSHTCSGMFSQHAAADIHFIVYTHIFAVTPPACTQSSLIPSVSWFFSPRNSTRACTLPRISLKTNAVFPLAPPPLCRFPSVPCLVP